MFLFSSFSACGATHKKNDDRVLSPSHVLTGAENPGGNTRFSEVVSLATNTLSSDAPWQKGGEFILPCSNSLAIAAVFDGVGGSARGNEAALAGASFLLDQRDKEKTLVDKLKECACHVSEKQAAYPKEEQGYTVASGFQICGYRYQKSPVPTNMSPARENEKLRPFFGCIPFNAGDSRTYRFSKGNALPLTDDHTLANYKASLGIGYSASDCNVVTKFLGGENLYPFDIYKAFKLEPGDIVFSCSDGFWEYIPKPLLEQALIELQEDFFNLLTPFKDSSLCQNAPDSTADCISGSRYEKQTIISTLDKEFSNQKQNTCSSAVPTNTPEKEAVYATYLFDPDKALSLFEKRVEYLVNTARDNGSPDDISVVFACYIPCEDLCEK